jgi:FG-GAP-like repeat/ASPIC and UnbV/Transmembrane protein 131-like N-terminal/Abnormal spindle-like microcephaly-assoc'd, ASPM-SPD-2-Hydin
MLKQLFFTLTDTRYMKIPANLWDSRTRSKIGSQSRGGFTMKWSVATVFVFLIFISTTPSVFAQKQCANAFGSLKTSPGELNFGEVNVGTTSDPMTFTIHNSGRTPLLVTKMVAQNSRFQLVGAPSVPFCVDPNDSIDIDVVFSPQQEGTVVSKIRTESSVGEVAFVGTVGTGVEEGGGEINLKVNPSSLDFGETEIETTSTKSFTIENNGSETVKIDDVSSNNNAFSVDSPSFPKDLNPGAEIGVTATFTPNKEGSFKGSFSIVVGSKTVASVSVAGRGEKPPGNPEVSLSPSTLNYGDLDVGTFKMQNMTVSNTGDADLDITFPSDDFLTCTPRGSFSIRPGKNTQITCKFIADIDRPISRNFTILTNDPDEKKVIFTVKANGQKGPFGFLNRTERSKIGPNPNKTSAVQIIDFDNDKKEDLYLTGFDGNLMCKNTGGAIFTNSTGQNKLGNNGSDARGVTWADVDNDGDLDVFIANFNAPSAVLKNNKGVFANQSGGLGLFASDNTPKATGGIWLDFNNDSRMDLFVVKDGAANLLFKNVGGFQFANVAGSAGVDSKGPGRAAVSADFNNDGLQDLYVVNFQKKNKMYFNNGNETFKDVSASAKVDFSGASQLAVAVDYDGDENVDLFVVNNNGPSLLYRNLGNGKFQNVAGAAGVAGPHKGRAATFSDFDRDGDYDLLLAQSDGANWLFANNNGKFSRVTNVDLSNANNPSSTAGGDTDNDGDVDVVIGDSDGGGNSGDSVFINSGGGQNHWLTLVLQGTQSNRSAIGAKVLVRTGNILQVGVVSSGNGKNEESLPLEFGLGAATTADVIVFWPSGKQQGAPGLAADRKVTITEQ